MRNIVIFGLIILSLMTVLIMKLMRMNPPVKINAQISGVNEAFIENRLNTYVHVTSVLADTGKEEILMGYIAPLSRKVIPKNLIRLLSPPNQLNIYVITPIGTKTIIPADNELSECDIDKIKYSQGWEKLATFDITQPIYSFYIGDIDAKLGATSYSDQSAGPAVYNNGIPFIEIFNMTNRTLQLNENIEIPPLGSRIYRGREHFGVPYGAILHDMEGIFPDYEIIYPISHLFYKGAVTELATTVPTYTFNVTDPLRSGLDAKFGPKDKTTFDATYEFGENHQYSNQKKFANKYR